MNRLMGRLAPLIVLGLFVGASAQASDISCKSSLHSTTVRCDDSIAGGPLCARHADRRPPAERLICDYAMLNVAYERIYADQRHMLNAGKIRPSEVLAWRRKRDACTTVKCVDQVFADWQRQAVTRRLAANPVQPSRKPLVAPGQGMPEGKSASEQPMREEVQVSMSPIPPMSPTPDSVAPSLTWSSPSPSPLMETSAMPSTPLASAHDMRALRLAPDAPALVERGRERAAWAPPVGLAWLAQLAPLIALGVGLDWVLTRRRVQWPTGVTAIVARLRGAPPIAFVLGGLLLLNGVLLAVIFATG
ncbi:hypothetical protein SAMN05216345_101872 [Cupriavidus sp. YR651]|uniref:hypothetical protein n=1 Tax=Cupriavidus sp. YR651 TaxID=1855315 RepID=UPI0008862724|nr:hypothetical protein [Cupriavidus sp. YR651]SDC19308.1 hypothetical protein SAMN05216345_101872 [Cupriavidus sp. YR651]